MITEKSPNANFEEWVKAHNPVEKTYSAEELCNMLEKIDSPEKQDRKWKQYDPHFLAAYDHTRKFYRSAYRDLLRHIFENYLPDVNFGIEIGCSANPSFYKMIPESLKHRWMMTDINLTAVAMTRHRHPESKVFCSSYHALPIKPRSQKLVATFNSLDMTNHTERAIEEIYRTLMDRGYMLLLQDVIPDDSATLLREHKNNKRNNIKVGLAKNSIISLETPDGMMDCRSYHHNDARKTAKVLGMEELFFGIIESSGLYKRHDEHESFGLDSAYRNEFGDIVSQPYAVFNPEIPDCYVKESVSANVLIMRK